MTGQTNLIRPDRPAALFLADPGKRGLSHNELYRETNSNIQPGAGNEEQH